MSGASTVLTVLASALTTAAAGVAVMFWRLLERIDRRLDEHERGCGKHRRKIAKRLGGVGSALTEIRRRMDQAEGPA